MLNGQWYPENYLSEHGGMKFHSYTSGSGPAMYTIIQPKLFIKGGTLKNSNLSHQIWFGSRLNGWFSKPSTYNTMKQGTI